MTYDYDINRGWWKTVEPTDDDNVRGMGITFNDVARAKRFATVLGRMAEATLKHGRPVLESVLIQASGDYLRMVASDGFVLSVVEINLGMNERVRGLGALSEPALFTRRDIQAIARTLKKSRSLDDPTLYITPTGEGQRVLSMDVLTQPSVLVTEQPGIYPNWQQLVPEAVGISPFALNPYYLTQAGRLFSALGLDARFMYGEAEQQVLIEGYGEDCRALAVIMPMYVGMEQYAEEEINGSG